MATRLIEKKMLSRLAFLGLCTSLFLLRGISAQDREAQDKTASSSELAKGNLDRVAASESQITTVLNANPGMLVELKRWVAEDAADRGQLLKDSDLTDSAILSRLGSDIRLRAAATRLLQRY